MKKNWVLRLGLLAMVLTLVTMPMVSSTYAKYVTEEAGTATARVAKWGVNMAVNASSIFGDAYSGNPGDVVVARTTGGVTVKAAVSAPQEKVFAPGTKGSFSFSLTGQPEVAVNLSVASTIALSDDWKVNGLDYQPIRFTLLADGTTDKYYVLNYDHDTNVATDPVTGYYSTDVVYLTAAQLQTAINSLTNTTTAPNTNLTLLSGVAGATGTYTVNWEWPFFVDVAPFDGLSDLTSIETTISGGYYTYDQADTELGKIFLDPASDDPTLTINLTITATQID